VGIAGKVRDVPVNRTHCAEKPHSPPIEIRLEDTLSCLPQKQQLFRGTFTHLSVVFSATERDSQNPYSTSLSLQFAIDRSASFADTTSSKSENVSDTIRVAGMMT
jgi:hypothetical protein